MTASTQKAVTTSPAISIIIPVYNVGSWLCRAVESLKAQTFSNFEILLVDDGSTDNSGEICDNLAKEDSRITAIHQENAGAAAARNVAIAAAKGTYLYFMDGDDWCESTMLADLFSFAEDNQLDLVVTGFYIDTYYAEDKYYQEQRNVKTYVYESQEEFRCKAHRLFDAQLLYAPWNKLYRRSYLAENNILFPATFWDDLPFNLDVIRNISKVGTLNGHYYHFLRARAESENTRYRSDMYEKREEEHQWLCDLYKHWEYESPEVRYWNGEIQDFLARRYTERLVGCVENLTNKNCTLANEEKTQEIKRIISTPQARKALLKAKPSSAMMKAMLIPYKMNNARLIKAESKVISLVKENNTNLFARLKAKQVSR